MISAVYRVDNVCRMCDGKPHYVKFSMNVSNRLKETATEITLID